MSSDGSTTRYMQLGNLTGFGTSLQVLRTNAAANGVEWATVATGGAPAGTTGEPQINSSGVFGVPGNILMGSGFMSMGSTVAVAGKLRFSNGTGAIITQRNAGNSADQTALYGHTSSLYIGATPTNTATFAGVYIYPTTQLGLGVNATSAIEINPTNILFDRPRLGQVGPYSSDGLIVLSLTTSSYTLNTDEYSRTWFSINGTVGNKSIVFPNVSTLDQAYIKIIYNVSVSMELSVGNGSGPTVLVSPGQLGIVCFTSFGAFGKAF